MPGPGGLAEVRVRLGPQRGTMLRATVEDPSGYQEDNARYAVIEGRAAPSVLLVTTSGIEPDAFFVERAAAVGDSAEALHTTRLSGQQFSGLPADALGAYAAVVLLGTRGIEHQGRERLGAYVRAGGGLLVAAGPDVDPAVVGDALRGTAMTTWRARGETRLRLAVEDRRHPIVRVFGGEGTLSNATFTRAALVAPAPAANVLARYTDGTPALVEEPAGAGRTLFFASDLNSQGNDLPVQPAFVPFLHETLRYLAAARGEREDRLVGDLPGTPGAKPGIVRPGGATGRPVAVNVDTRESNPARISAAAFDASVARLHVAGAAQASVEIREREDSDRLWQYGLLLMVVTLAAETVVARRLG
jgi:hypothetical protein